MHQSSLFQICYEILKIIFELFFIGNPSIFNTLVNSTALHLFDYILFQNLLNINNNGNREFIDYASKSIRLNLLHRKFWNISQCHAH